MHVIKGKATWAKVHEPDTRYVPEGVFSINVSVPEAESSALCEQLEGVLKEYADKLVKEQPKLKATLSIRNPFETEYDDDGNKTGDVLFKPKMKALITTRDGKQYPRTVAVVDAKRNPIDKTTLIGNGSVVKAAFEVAPYYVAAQKVAGLTLRLKAVQVLELKEFGNNSATSLFEEEDGFVAKAVEKDNSTDVFDDGDAVVSDDEGDF